MLTVRLFTRKLAKNLAPFEEAFENHSLALAAFKSALNSISLLVITPSSSKGKTKKIIFTGALSHSLNGTSALVCTVAVQCCH